jgi:hypothetical protein
LQDPTIELRDSSRTLVGRNDNWRTTELGGAIGEDQANEIKASTVAPTEGSEAAIIATLDPGAYTAITRGADGGVGIALVELYDLAPSASARLANISTRGQVGIGDDVLIGGIILGGTELSEVLLRAIGPSLADAGVSDTLGDPTLELHDGNGELIVINDNWKDTQRDEIEATGIPPSRDQEAAILTVLQPGNYTAIVRGVNGTFGIALVEAYALHQSNTPR